jgi:flagellar basal-body rod protein FlgG
MIRSLYTAATGMDAQQTRMDTIANNLANASTTGFKKVNASFEDLLSETIRSPRDAAPQGGSPSLPLQVGLGTRVASTIRSFSQGDMVQTQNPTNVAIAGNGFFRIQRPNGDYAYTRAGDFTTDSDGRLVTGSGLLVDPQITIPKDASDLVISADGIVTAKQSGQTQATELGRLELANFVNPAGLEAIGGNLLIETAASGQATISRPGEQEAGTLQQGWIESSNVKAVEEMVAMISTQRAYELNSKVISSADQMLQRLTNVR